MDWSAISIRLSLISFHCILVVFVTVWSVRDDVFVILTTLGEKSEFNKKKIIHHAAVRLFNLLFIGCDGGGSTRKSP